MKPADTRGFPREPTLSPWRRRMEAVALSLLGGVIWLLAVRFEATGPLLALAFVLLVTPAAVERWSAPLWGYVPGHFLYCILGHIPASKYTALAFLVLPIVLSWSYFTQAVFAGALRRHTTLPAWITIPVALGAGEWLRPFLDPGGFNMYQIGSFLFHWPLLIQAADIVGSAGLTVLIALPFAAGVEALRLWTGSAKATHRSVATGGLASMAVLALLIGYGLWRETTVPAEDGPRIAIIQPSLDHGRDLIESVLTEQQLMTARWVEPGQADIVVWPENAILAPLEYVDAYRKTVAWVASSREAMLLLGAQGFDPLTGKRPTNSVYLIDKEGKIVGRYNKVVLFPFTERRVFPAMERLWPWLSKQIVRLTLIAWEDAPNGWGAPDAIPLHARIAGKDWTFWTPICYETCYSSPARDARLQGARFFVNLTSEGWLGWGTTRNMLGVSILRAVENRVGVVRAANAGISCFINPTGRVDAFLVGDKHGRRLLDAGHLMRRVRAGGPNPTIYAQFGAWMDGLWFMLALLILFGTWLSRFAGRWRQSPQPPQEMS